MNDTQKYIQAYKKALPRMKEKVIAALAMLIISAVTATSASFAWVALSTAPEVSGLETTVAANGNLEIALSDVDGLEPEKSEVGDSGKNIVSKNITWGNLVNLSDTSYGLEKLTLRPAALNTTGDMLKSPLRAAVYGLDGRVNITDDNMMYTTYDPTANDNEGAFIVYKNENNQHEERYGVRAVSTVKTGANTQGQVVYKQILSETYSAWDAAIDKYESVHADVDGKENPNITVLKELLDIYIDYTLNSVNADVTTFLPDFLQLMEQFEASMDLTAEALCKLAYAQQYPSLADESKMYTADQLCAAALAGDFDGENSLIKIDGLKQFASDRAEAKQYVAELQGYIDSKETVKWSKVNHIVYYMVDVDTLTIGGYTVKELQKMAQNITANVGTLLGLRTTDTKIYGGAMYNLEKMMLMSSDTSKGFQFYNKGGRDRRFKLNIKHSALSSLGGSMQITTTVDIMANEPFYFEQAYKTTSAYGGSFSGSDAVAQDTYGMAIDFWLRTNAANAYLILEGNPVIVQTNLKDKDGNDVLDENENPVLVDSVEGYEGENRVWGDYGLTDASTTQGSGSCYIFYADDPAVQQTSLELLKSMEVAFITDEGNVLAYAVMDTEHAYEEMGKITVPLVLSSSSMEMEDEEGNAITEDGNPVYAITKMEQNTPVRITAVLYVNGTKLFNEDVLAEVDIQGQFNIQFGLSEDMIPMEDEENMYDEIHITASADKATMEFSAEGNSATVTANINGITPQTVTASFTRKINQYQGTRQTPVTFTNVSGNQWKATQQFLMPGTYVLRDIMLDGVSYDLDNSIEISVTGSAITKLACLDIPGGLYLSSDEDVTTRFALGFSASDYKPSSVKGVIVNQDGEQTITNFTQSTTDYITTVKFKESGTYTMKYVILDDEWFEIDSAMQKTLDIYLGVNATVKIDVPEDTPGLNGTSFDLEEPTTVSATLSLYDGSGERITDVSNLMEPDTSTGTEKYIGLLEYDHESSATIMLQHEMEWDKTTDTFKGDMLVSSPGVYSFDYFKLGENFVTASINSDKITAIPTEPPEYIGYSVAAYQLAPNNDAAFKVEIANAEAAIVTATIRYTDTNTTKEKEVNVGKPDGNIFTITIPTDMGKVAGKQDGNWQLVDVRLANVYYEDKFHTAVDPVIWNMTTLAGKDVKTKVVSTIKVTVAEDKQDGTASEGAITYAPSTMLSSHEIDDFVITISDFDGKPIEYTKEDGTNVVVEDVLFRYKLTWAGGAFLTTGNIAERSMTTVTTTVVADSNGTKFDVPDIDFKYAGTYKIGAQFTLDGKTYIVGVSEQADIDAGKVSIAPSTTILDYKFSWIQPSVTVTGTNPAVGTNFNAATTNEPYVGKANAIDSINNKATVYFKSTKRTFLWNTYYNYSTSSVELTLAGLGSYFDSAKMTVGTSAYNLALDKGVSVAVGKVESKTFATDLKTHGGGTASTITVIGKDGITYTVTITNPVTIENP